MTDLDEGLFFNGVNGSTGDYGLQPMANVQSLYDIVVADKKKPDDFATLRDRQFRQENASFVIKEGLDPTDLAQAGWGVVFPVEGFDPRIEEALAELLKWRLDKAGEGKFYVYKGEMGYRPGESKQAFMARHGHSPVGPVDPDIFPYYVLIVAGPEQIPFRFQYELDVQCNVGRIYFDALEGYANYARSVVAAEREQVRLPRRMSFFGPSNADDRATQLSRAELIAPLRDQLQKQRPDWHFADVLGEDALKTRLADLLGGAETPAVLFTASHGMEFEAGDARQAPHQGALLCQDWPGPRRWRDQGGGPLPESYYFSGDDVAADAKLWGSIAFFFACYGAGTPLLDDYARQAWRDRMPIADRPFVARLPQRLLGHPRGGALAVVGHVERAWGYSFKWPKVKPVGSNPNRQQVETFTSAFTRLLAGKPIGEAMNYFDDRFANVAVLLNGQLDEAEWGKVDPYELVALWTANNDARGYVILGDPAVCLPLAPADLPADEQEMTRGAIAAVDVTTLVSAPAGPAPTVDSTAAVAEAAAAGESAAVEFGLLGDKTAELRAALQRATRQLADLVASAVDDLTTLDVRTYTATNLRGLQGDRLAEDSGAVLRALTRVKLDGDLESVVPVREAESLRTDDLVLVTEIDETLWQVHRDMVALAQQNKVEFLKAVADIAGSLLGAIK